MAKMKYKQFLEGMPRAEEFKKLWLEQHGDGAQNVIAKHFDLSIPLVYRIRVMLKLPHLHSEEHPGRREFRKRVKRLYYEHKSTERVGKIVGMSSQRVNQILREERVSLFPQHVSNILSYPPTNGMSQVQFNKACKRMYAEGMTINQIAADLEVDTSSVSKRLKAMGIELRQNHKHVQVPGGYPCLWCKKIMEQVWITKGPRKQRYCGSSCKNKGKDLRKYLDADRRVKAFQKELQQIWGDEWEEQLRKISLRANASRANGKYFPAEQ